MYIISFVTHLSRFTGLAADLGGTFAEYTLADARVVISIPESLSFEDAATLGLAGYTACQTLWQSLTLPTPLEPTKGHLPVCIEFYFNLARITLPLHARSSFGAAQRLSGSTLSSLQNSLAFMSSLQHPQQTINFSRTSV